MQTIGSQKRETLEEADLIFIKRIDENEIILQNTEAKYEVWTKNNQFAGYVVTINGIGYEFVRTMNI